MSGAKGKGAFEPRIVALYCQHSIKTDSEQTDSYRDFNGFHLRQVVMPCSSKVEVGQLIKILENGADGILVVACPDHACRFLVGSNRAERRIRYVRQILEEIDFGPERVEIVREKDLSREGFLELVKQRSDLIRPLGPNPMRAESI